eukprot:GEMP01033897.1.p1 GENE.GEMP01033897.1~~GEMP01033897.1.p1  ORF type:complete len:322 (-),score=42.99 GEMP01033897.1:1108-2073(-)
MSGSRLLFANDFGDPISAIYVNDVGCMAGSYLGKVWRYQWDTEHWMILAPYSDNSVRSVYMTPLESYAMIGERTIRAWEIEHGVPMKKKLNFDPKAPAIGTSSVGSVKFVCGWQHLVVVLYPTTTVVMNLPSCESVTRSFRLFDNGGAARTACPTDFDGEALVCVDRGDSISIKVIYLERNEVFNVVNVPDVDTMSFVKLWGPKCLVYVTKARDVVVYNYTARFAVHRWQHKSDVIALDTANPTYIFVLLQNGDVNIWNGDSGKREKTEKCPPGVSFHMGWPYFISVHETHIVVSCDEGVAIVETGWRPAARSGAIDLQIE